MRKPVYGRTLFRSILGVFLCSLCSIRMQAEDLRGHAMSSPTETFGEGDDPRVLTVSGNEISTPYGYDRAANTTRKYALVVIGRWGEGNTHFTTEIRKRYPSFYLSFPHSDEADGARLSDIIDAALGQGLRIDVNRILYTGFSAGGSGSFKLVRGLASKGKYFAGLNRIAGQSESVLEESATGRTAVWLHQGLKDTPLRVATSRALYENLKKHPINEKAVETQVRDTVKKDTPRTTWILTKHGVEVVRYSEYPTCEHDSWIGYSDPYMFKWLFSRDSARKED